MGYTGCFNKQEEDYLKERLLSVIPNEPCGTSSKDLSDLTGLNSRDVRLLIQKLRNEHYPICGTPEHGYWIAKYPGELNDTINRLQSHVKNCNSTILALQIAQSKLQGSEENDI